MTIFKIVFQSTKHRNPPNCLVSCSICSDVYKLLHTPEDRAPSFVHKAGNHLYEGLLLISRISSLRLLDK